MCSRVEGLWDDPYTKETHEAKIGSLELSVNEKQTVSIPIWIGVGALVAGGFLLLVPKQS